MSGTINPECTTYIETIRKLPLSETISEVQSLYDGDLRLHFKSDESEVNGEKGNYSKGRVIGYRDINSQELFVYLGLQYVDNQYDRIYPASFFFGTDLEKGKLEEFLGRLHEEIHYFNRKNVIEFGQSLFLASKNSLLMTCVESHKARKKGLYDELCSLPFNSNIEELKQALDKSEKDNGR